MDKPKFKHKFVRTYRKIDYGWVVSDYHYLHSMRIGDYMERFYQGTTYNLPQSALEELMEEQNKRSLL